MPKAAKATEPTGKQMVSRVRETIKAMQSERDRVAIDFDSVREAANRSRHEGNLAWALVQEQQAHGLNCKISAFDLAIAMIETRTRVGMEL